MFYCKDCADITGWPEFGFSVGRCEMCERGSMLCSDVPSKYLSIPTQEMHTRIQGLNPHRIQEEP